MSAISRNRVKINISGEIYETFENTLTRYPKTLLGNLDKLKPFYCCKKKEYFLNRNRTCFGAILYFYQSYGILSCPHGVNIKDFEEECEFFQLPNTSIHKMKTKGGVLFDDDENEKKSSEDIHQRRVWNFLDDPRSSTLASYFAIFSLIMITLSVLASCLETVPELFFTGESFWENPWMVAEFLLNIWFLMEFTFRMVFSPIKIKFFKSFLNLIDVVGIIPYFIILTYDFKYIKSVSFLRMLRLLRIFRLFRLSKHSKRIKVVGRIIKSSLQDFQILMLCLAMLMVCGGSLMYYMEESITSIPLSLWWAIQTITTLGYGDITPVTIPGKCFAAGFMAFGALTISLPVLSIVTKFASYYSTNI